MTMPQALLEKSVGKRVSLLLKDGRVMEGKLVGFDDLMNMSLEETVETVPGTEERRLDGRRASHRPEGVRATYAR